MCVDLQACSCMEDLGSHFTNDSAPEVDRGVRIFQRQLDGIVDELLVTEFVMGTENKIQAFNPAGEHVISECWLRHRLCDSYLKRKIFCEVGL